jgi:hypothetical protein
VHFTAADGSKWARLVLHLVRAVVSLETLTHTRHTVYCNDADNAAFEITYTQFGANATVRFETAPEGTPSVAEWGGEEACTLASEEDVALLKSRVLTPRPSILYMEDPYAVSRPAIYNNKADRCLWVELYSRYGNTAPVRAVARVAPPTPQYQERKGWPQLAYFAGGGEGTYRAERVRAWLRSVPDDLQAEGTLFSVDNTDYKVQHGMLVKVAFSIDHTQSEANSHRVELHEGCATCEPAVDNKRLVSQMMRVIGMPGGPTAPLAWTGADVAAQLPGSKAMAERMCAVRDKMIDESKKQSWSLLEKIKRVIEKFLEVLDTFFFLRPGIKEQVSEDSGVAYASWMATMAMAMVQDDALTASQTMAVRFAAAAVGHKQAAFSAVTQTWYRGLLVAVDVAFYLAGASSGLVPLDMADPVVAKMWRCVMIGLTFPGVMRYTTTTFMNLQSLMVRAAGGKFQRALSRGATFGYFAMLLSPMAPVAARRLLDRCVTAATTNNMYLPHAGAGILMLNHLAGHHVPERFRGVQTALVLLAEISTAAYTAANTVRVAGSLAASAGKIAAGTGAAGGLTRTVTAAGGVAASTAAAGELTRSAVSNATIVAAEGVATAGAAAEGVATAGAVAEGAASAGAPGLVAQAVDWAAANQTLAAAALSVGMSIVYARHARRQYKAEQEAAEKKLRDERTFKIETEHGTLYVGVEATDDSPTVPETHGAVPTDQELACAKMLEDLGKPSEEYENWRRARRAPRRRVGFGPFIGHDR